MYSGWWKPIIFFSNKEFSGRERFTGERYLLHAMVCLVDLLYLHNHCFWAKHVEITHQIREDIDFESMLGSSLETKNHCTCDALPSPQLIIGFFDFVFYCLITIDITLHFNDIAYAQRLFFMNVIDVNRCIMEVLLWFHLVCLVSEIGINIQILIVKYYSRQRLS